MPTVPSPARLPCSQMGTPVILYTGAHFPAAAPCPHGALPGSHRALADAGAAACAGVSNFSRLGYYYQQQAMLRPTNASDPELQMWCAAAPLHEPGSRRTLCLQWLCLQWAAAQALTVVLGRHKPHFNPLVVAPPAAGGNYAQFRDPTTAWRQDGLWYTAIGVQANCIGGASLYSSPDMRNWTYVGQLASQLGINAIAGPQCSAPPVLQPGNGACDQMGADCHTWVCTPAGICACLAFLQGFIQHIPYRLLHHLCKGRAVAAGWSRLLLLESSGPIRVLMGLPDVQECPDYFSMDYGVSVLKWSDQVPARANVFIWHCLGVKMQTRPAARNLLLAVFQAPMFLSDCEPWHALGAGARPHALCRRLVHALQRRCARQCVQRGRRRRDRGVQCIHRLLRAVAVTAVRPSTA